VRLSDRLRRRPRLLVVTAVEAERAAVLRGLGLPDLAPDYAIASLARIVVQAAGVGCAAAGAATARSLARAEAADAPFAMVVSTGVAGGFVGRAGPGATVLASRSVAADLGAESAEGGLLTLATLGFGSSTVEVSGSLLTSLRTALPGAVEGEVLTVCTVTGTAGTTAALLARHPQAVAEAMEGFAVGTAAEQAGAAFAELRTISNLVGPRDRDAWRLPEALAALKVAAAALASLEP
jgi:futalosine hydrolase